MPKAGAPAGMAVASSNGHSIPGAPAQPQVCETELVHVRPMPPRSRLSQRPRAAPPFPYVCGTKFFLQQPYLNSLSLAVDANDGRHSLSCVRCFDCVAGTMEDSLCVSL